MKTAIRSRGCVHRLLADMVLNQSRRETGSQSFRKQPAGRGLGLQLRYDCSSLDFM